MNALKIPTGMPTNEIQEYLRSKKIAKRFKRPAPTPPPTIPDDAKGIEIKGDDWTTRSRGVSGRQLKKAITMLKARV